MENDMQKLAGLAIAQGLKRGDFLRSASKAFDAERKAEIDRKQAVTQGNSWIDKKWEDRSTSLSKKRAARS